MNECPCCESDELEQIDYEFICQKCGCAYSLEYIGYYKEGSNDRIDTPNPECKEEK